MPELPPPLPPAQRTVGQLVAESIRAYGESFWRALPLGLPFALLTQLGLGSNAQIPVLWLLAPAFSAAYIAASALVLPVEASRRRLLRALLVGTVVWLPVPLLLRALILPSVVWLAFFGLAVPATLVEGLGFRAALGRARRLAAADFVHALGSLCALVIVVFVSATALGALLHGEAEAARRVSSFLALLVLSPLLYIGGAILYLDQAARVGSRGRAPDADLHPPVDPDPAGRPDAPLEP
jgi:hypothetical protein